MISGDDLFVCLVAGLAMPLAILDLVRTWLDDRLPMQEPGLQFERRLMPWLLTAFAGPALLLDRTAQGWREKTMSSADVAWGAVITLGWAAIYGFVALTFVNAVAA
jgi:hypothetical protein